MKKFRQMPTALRRLAVTLSHLTKIENFTSFHTHCRFQVINLTFGLFKVHFERPKNCTWMPCGHFLTGVNFATFCNRTINSPITKKTGMIWSLEGWHKNGGFKGWFFREFTYKNASMDSAFKSTAKTFYTPEMR